MAFDRGISTSWANTLRYGVAFFWAGLVIGLSFIETPLKFRAPGVTLEIGLGIGRLVFSTLNRIELGLIVLLFVSLALAKAGRLQQILFVVLAAIVFLQTFWLLPALDARAEMVILGNPPPPTSHHIVFVAMESTKAACLLLLGALRSPSGVKSPAAK